MVKGLKLYDCYYRLFNSHFGASLKLNYKKDGALIHSVCFSRVLDLKRSVIYRNVPKEDLALLVAYSDGILTNRDHFVKISNKLNILNEVSYSDLNCALFSAREFDKTELYFLSSKNGDFKR